MYPILALIEKKQGWIAGVFVEAPEVAEACEENTAISPITSWASTTGAMIGRTTYR
jgi:hypothetical protein